MNTCPSCGRKIGSETTKCGNCGVSISSISPTFRCSACGKLLDGNETVCPACGYQTSFENETSKKVSTKLDGHQSVEIRPILDPEEAEVSWKWRNYVFTAALNASRKVAICPKCRNDLDVVSGSAATGKCGVCGTVAQLSETEKAERPLFPLIPRLKIINKSNEKVRVQVQAYVSPDLTSRWVRTFDGVSPNGTIEIKDEIDPIFVIKKLGNMPNRANLHLHILFNDREVWSDTREIKILSYNQMVWRDKNGQQYFPFLRCFVTPNNSSITGVIQTAKHHLQNLTGRVDFVGYQWGEKYAKFQVKAIYQTLKEDYQISYTNMPPSFDKVGTSQSILLPQEVLAIKSGNCLELAILFATCIERIGIDPVIFLIRGHAFPGFFGQEEIWRDEIWKGGMSNSSVQIRDLTSSKTLVPFEAASISMLSFEQAIENINEEKKLTADVFNIAINIRYLRELDSVNLTPLSF